MTTTLATTANIEFRTSRPPTPAAMWLATLASLLPLVLRGLLCEWTGVDPICETSAFVRALDERDAGTQQQLIAGGLVNARFQLDGMSVFHSACVGGSLEAVYGMAARDHGLLAARTANGQSCLSLAAEQGHAKVVEFLVRNAAANANDASADGATPLIRALRRKHVDIARFLLANRADVNAKAAGTAPTGAVSPDILREPSTAAFGTIMYPVTPLQIAVSQGDVDTAAAMLRRDYGNAPVAVNERNDFGVTALMMAASGDAPQLVKLLVAYGADTTLAANGGVTAAGFAVWNSAADALQAVLVAAGASAEDDSGSSEPTALARLFATVTHHRQSLLHLAAKRGNVDVLEVLLRVLGKFGGSGGAGVGSAAGDADDAAGDGTADEGMPSLARALQARDVHGATPLHVACAERHAGAMRVLLVAPGAGVNARNRRGLTCAMLVAGMPSQAAGVLNPRVAGEVISLLRAAGADLDAASDAGVRALAMAVMNGQPHLTAALLREGGASAAFSMPDGTSFARLVSSTADAAAKAATGGKARPGAEATAAAWHGVVATVREALQQQRTA